MRVHVWMAVLLVTMKGLYAADVPQTPLSTSATDIDGRSVELGSYTGKVVMVVNVASRCGFTKQYAQLQSLYEKYRERGFVVLGFPCNQFGKQEPGTDAEIKAFCDQRFSVTFPMFSKIDVKGDDAHPLYQYLTSNKVPIQDRGPVKWNFEKFLIDRTGQVVARYRSRVKPDALDVMMEIEKALGPVADEKRGAGDQK